MSFFCGDKLYLVCDMCKQEKGVMEITGDRIVYGKLECEECLTKYFEEKRKKEIEEK